MNDIDLYFFATFYLFSCQERNKLGIWIRLPGCVKFRLVCVKFFSVLTGLHCDKCVDEILTIIRKHVSSISYILLRLLLYGRSNFQTGCADGCLLTLNATPRREKYFRKYRGGGVKLKMCVSVTSARLA